MKQFLIDNLAERDATKEKAKIAGAMLWYKTLVFKVPQSGEIPVFVSIGWNLPLSQIPHFLSLGHKALSKE